MSIEIYHLVHAAGPGEGSSGECTLTLLFHQFQPSRRIKIPELPDIPARLFPRGMSCTAISKRPLNIPLGNDVAERFF